MTNEELIQSLSGGIAKKIKENISYTSRDYDNILKDMITLLVSGELETVWNNISEADIIFIFLSLLAAHTDMLNYYLDNRALENTLLTAKEGASVLRFVLSFGYVPRGRVAPSLQIATTQELEKWQQYNDNNNIAWTFLGDTLDNDTKKILYCGIKNTIELESNNIDTIKNTIAFDGGRALLQNSFNLKRSLIEVSVGDIEFTYVDKITDYSNTSTQFTTLSDVLGIIHIRFGRPKSAFQGEKINVAYLQEAEDILNIGAPTSIFIGGIEEELTADNSIFIKGKAAETINEIKENFAQFYLQEPKLVSIDDYAFYLKNLSPFATRVNRVAAYDRFKHTSNISTEVIPQTGENEVKEKETYIIYEPIIIQDTSLSLLINEEIQNKKFSFITTFVSAATPVEVSVKVNNSQTIGQAEIKELLEKKPIGSKLTRAEIIKTLLRAGVLDDLEPTLEIKIDGTTTTSSTIVDESLNKVIKYKAA